MLFPTPTTHVQHFLPLSHRPGGLATQAQSFWPPLPGQDTALGKLASRPQRTQQFQKNMSQNEQDLTSEPASNSLHTPLSENELDAPQHGVLCCKQMRPQ